MIPCGQRERSSQIDELKFAKRAAAKQDAERIHFDRGFKDGTMTALQFNGINLYTLAQIRQHEPKRHARILNIAGEWMVLFGNKVAFTDDADLVGILHEANLLVPQTFADKRAAADFLDAHTESFASVSC